MVKHNKKEQISPTNEAFKISLIYFIGSSLWIFLSDSFVFTLFGEAILSYSKMQTYKGIFFILLSSSMIYFLVYNSLIKIDSLDRSLEKKIAEIQYLGSYDNITGLPNSEYLETIFNNILQTSEEDKFAFLYIDIDNFSHINDLLGFANGDVLLSIVGERIRTFIGDIGLIFKLSGDEFGVILMGVNSELEINRVVEDLQKSIHIPIELEGELFYTSSTIGISLMPKDGNKFNILIQKSNIAMQHGKTHTKTAHSYYSEEMQEKVLNNVSILSDVRKALLNNEFRLHYQIIKNLENDSIYAVESLLRWYHPVKGYISPMSYIPIAENTNLIYEIEYFVVNEALRQKKEWNDKGVNIPKIGINMSLKSFCSEGIITKIEKKLVEYDIKKEEMVIELTESGVIGDMETLIPNIERLRKIGVRISLDDFGTGYSSLARLMELPLDSLKIDKSFIDNIHTNKDNEAMVTGIIYFANSLGMLIIAEGIEKQEQIEKLKSLGCSLGQGYHIAKPMSPEDLEVLIG